MPLTGQVRERCRAFLPAGVRITYLFPARSVAIGSATLGTAPFIIVITDAEIFALGCSSVRKDLPNSLWARYPRATRLGPVDLGPADLGTAGPTLTLGNLVLEIEEEYVPVVRAADAEIGAAGQLPQDPLPDL